MAGSRARRSPPALQTRSGPRRQAGRGRRGIPQLPGAAVASAESGIAIRIVIRIATMSVTISRKSSPAASSAKPRMTTLYGVAVSRRSRPGLAMSRPLPVEAARDSPRLVERGRAPARPGAAARARRRRRSPCWRPRRYPTSSSRSASRRCATRSPAGSPSGSAIRTHHESTRRPLGADQKRPLFAEEPDPQPPALERQPRRRHQLALTVARAGRRAAPRETRSASETLRAPSLFALPERAPVPPCPAARRASGSPRREPSSRPPPGRSTAPARSARRRPPRTAPPAHAVHAVHSRSLPGQRARVEAPPPGQLDGLVQRASAGCPRPARK